MIQSPFFLFANPRPAVANGQGRVTMDETQKNQPELHQRLLDFMRLTQDWAWEADETLKLTVASRQAFDVIGHHADDMLGKPLTDFGAFIDKHGNPKRLSMNGNFRDACFVATDSRGDQRQLCVSAIAFFDPDTGAFAGVRGIARPLKNQLDLDK